MTPLLLRFEFRILPDLEYQGLSLVSLFLFRALCVLQELITDSRLLTAKNVTIKININNC
ncbi:unknown protein [Microcystis aeruginosa NIES-843]|uniref:Uncharacterized protein n=1 Tax=Microcystis aeruginosa (strain NIES-843 / IAM M-2473) TaxID=449447 RepID=B0JPA6_MICAN|nr:unknown protein [Microcystis aeruginosa NIES-843]